MLVSIVIPCYQNQDQLNSTIEQIISLAEHIDGYTFELLLIDDASTDNTWQSIMHCAQQFEEVRGIRLGENIGAYNAILYGFEMAIGELILVMAADGDDPPELLKQLMSTYNDSCDAVLAVRESSEKGITSILLSRTFYLVLKMLGARNVHPSGSDFMLFKRKLYEKSNEQGWKSGNTLIQIIQHAEQIRTIGYRKGNSRKSTWTFTKKLSLLLETANQFLPIPGIFSSAKATSVSDKA